MVVVPFAAERPPTAQSGFPVDPSSPLFAARLAALTKPLPGRGPLWPQEPCVWWKSHSRSPPPFAHSTIPIPTGTTT